MRAPSPDRTPPGLPRPWTRLAPLWAALLGLVASCGAAGALAALRSPGEAGIDRSFAVPDTHGLDPARVVRIGPALAVLPAVVDRALDERPRWIPVRLQSAAPALVTVRVESGRHAIRFRRAGSVNVVVRAAAAFLPPLRRLTVRLTISSGRGLRSARTTIAIRG